MIKDVMNSANQVVEGLKQATGIDIGSILAGAAGGKVVAAAQNGQPSAGTNE